MQRDANNHKSYNNNEHLPPLLAIWLGAKVNPANESLGVGTKRGTDLVQQVSSTTLG